MPPQGASARCSLPIRFFDRYRLHGRNHILELGDLAQNALGWQPVVLGHRQDEGALARFKTFKEGVELVGYGPAVAVCAVL